MLHIYFPPQGIYIISVLFLKKTNLPPDTMKSELFCLCLLATLWGKISSCPDVTGFEDFEVDELAGVWYDVQMIPNAYLKDIRCVRLTMTKKGKGQFDVVKTAIDKNTNKNVKFSGTSTFSEDNPANFIFNLPPVLPNHKYVVLDAVEDSYLVSYRCEGDSPNIDQELYIVSRSPEISKEKVKEIKRKLLDMNISAANYLHPIDQTNCTYD